MNDENRHEYEVDRELYEQTMSQEIGELAAALAKAQGAIHGAAKGSDNPFFKSKYADLSEVWSACREQLSSNSLAVVQTTEPCSEGVIVVTTLVHSSGQWMRGKLRMRPEKNTPQAIGSTITYARRYALAAIVGVAQVDDDAEAAMGRNGTQKGAINGTTVDLKKITVAVQEAEKIMDNPDEQEAAQQAKELYKTLNTDERLAFQPMLKEIKYGKKMAWSAFRELLDIAAEQERAA